MRIKYVTDYDASDLGAWSGTGNFLARALERDGCHLDFIGPLRRPVAYWPILKAKGLLYNGILGRRYHPAHDLAVAKHFASVVDRALRQSSPDDLVFSPGTIPIAFLETDRPTAFWSDSTHASLFNFYPEYCHLSRDTLRAGHRIEQRAIDRASAILMSSEWAADSAVRDYGADRKKVHVVPFGANLHHSPSFESVAAAVRSRPTRCCRLLFIGVDWARKGGDLAVQVAEDLNQIGLPTRLTIVGCNPFKDKAQPDFVHCEGFLAKGTKTGSGRIGELLAGSHFLLVPSVAECFGLVYCEASAYGVPSLARSVGGVPTIVRNEINGHLFSSEAPSTEYARFIESLFLDYARYIDLALSSAQEFAARLNWDVAAKQAHEILRAVVRPP